MAEVEPGLDAIVGGTLQVDLDAGCVWVGGPDGSRYPVVWPRGTTASEDPFQVLLPDGAQAVPGDAVFGGGGYVDASGGDWDPFPAECVQTGTAAVW